jgi:hypothetical protein
MVFDVNSFVEILFVEMDNCNKTKSIPIRLDFVPFSHEEFVNRLENCSLKIQFDSFKNDCDFYHIILEK